MEGPEQPARRSTSAPGIRGPYRQGRELSRARGLYFLGLAPAIATSCRPVPLPSPDAGAKSAVTKKEASYVEEAEQDRVTSLRYVCGQCGPRPTGAAPVQAGGRGPGGPLGPGYVYSDDNG